MNTDKLLNLLSYALAEADNYALTHHAGKTAIDNTKNVLQLLKEQVINNPENINERVLRAMHDLGMYSYKYFENSQLENAIIDVISILDNEISTFKILKPLSLDFGKGHPI